MKDMSVPSGWLGLSCGILVTHVRETAIPKSHKCTDRVGG